jgi:hypothetical protein
MITGVYWSSCSAHYSFQILMMKFLDKFSENTHNIKFHEISVPWELSCSSWAADRPDEANSCFFFAVLRMHQKSKRPFLMLPFESYINQMYIYKKL